MKCCCSMKHDGDCRDNSKVDSMKALILLKDGETVTAINVDVTLAINQIQAEIMFVGIGNMIINMSEVQSIEFYQAKS